MLTNNFNAWLKTFVLGTTSGYTTIMGTSKTFNTQYGYSNYPFGSSTLGTVANTSTYAYPASAETFSSASAGRGVWLGTGTTPAKFNDYTLESPLSNSIGLTNVAGKITSAPDGDGTYIVYVDHVLTNTSDADISFSEVGLVGALAVASGSYAMVLFDRTVLDEPFVIPAGKSKLFTYKFTFNHG